VGIDEIEEIKEIKSTNMHGATIKIKKNILFQSLLKTQHVSSGTPLIIRSYKLYFAASGLHIHVVTGRCHSALATAGHHMGI
jgi:hypothetical protein